MLYLCGYIDYTICVRRGPHVHVVDTQGLECFDYAYEAVKGHYFFWIGHKCKLGRPWAGMVTWVKEYTEKDCPRQLKIQPSVRGDKLELMGPRLSTHTLISSDREYRFDDRCATPPSSLWVSLSLSLI